MTRTFCARPTTTWQIAFGKLGCNCSWNSAPIARRRNGSSASPRDEVLDILSEVRNEITLGVGKDAVVMRHRGVEDAATRPIMHSGPTGTPASERYHPLILLSCAQEPLVDCLGAGSVSTYFGEKIIPGTPLEILGARRDASVAREAVRMAGRPGMHINDVAVSLTCAGKMAACDPQAGLRPSDGILVSQMVELKTDFDQLSASPISTTSAASSSI